MTERRAWEHALPTVTGLRTLGLALAVHDVARLAEGLPALLAQDAQVLVEAGVALALTEGLDQGVVAVVEGVAEAGELVHAVDEQLVGLNGALGEGGEPARQRLGLGLEAVVGHDAVDEAQALGLAGVVDLAEQEQLLGLLGAGEVGGDQQG